MTCLLGSLVAPVSRPVPPTVDVAADTIILDFSDPGQLETWKGRTLREVNLDVQVRYAPGFEVAKPQ
jgi:hypothetical protein